MPGERGERVRAFADTVRADVRGVVDMVQHRIHKGSPVLLAPLQDVGVSSSILSNQAQERIKRRRALLGLDYEEFSPRR